MTAADVARTEWHVERHRACTTGEPTPRPGDTGYRPDPDEYQE